jgi:hypothetical protein
MSLAYPDVYCCYRLRKRVLGCRCGMVTGVELWTLARLCTLHSPVRLVSSVQLMHPKAR